MYDESVCMCVPVYSPERAALVMEGLQELSRGMPVNLLAIAAEGCPRDGAGLVACLATSSLAPEDVIIGALRTWSNSPDVRPAVQAALAYCADQFDGIPEYDVRLVDEDVWEDCPW